MSLICLDILWRENPEQLAARIVDDSLTLLRDKDTKVQKKGVRTLSSLAQTKAGEQAIKPRVTEIVRMLLPPSDGSAPPRSQLFGPTAALYDLCKNETLREQIRGSDDFTTFMILRRRSTLYPQTRSEN
ncbi:hypothetical protein OG21DRAFT_1511662 [Imleria badia]|nr:hypothetical protein OG21DRAFT_1511662 [Imleria badia]